MPKLRRLSRARSTYFFRYALLMGRLPSVERYNVLNDLVDYEFIHYAKASGWTWFWSFLFSFKPVIDMGEDLVESVLPYKSERHTKLDLMQPVRGLGNLTRGLFWVGSTPLVFFVAAIFIFVHLMAAPASIPYVFLRK